MHDGLVDGLTTRLNPSSLDLFTHFFGRLNKYDDRENAETANEQLKKLRILKLMHYRKFSDNLTEIDEHWTILMNSRSPQKR